MQILLKDGNFLLILLQFDKRHVSLVYFESLYLLVFFLSLCWCTYWAICTAGLRWTWGPPPHRSHRGPRQWRSLGPPHTLWCLLPSLMPGSPPQHCPHTHTAQQIHHWSPGREDNIVHNVFNLFNQFFYDYTVLWFSNHLFTYLAGLGYLS